MKETAPAIAAGAFLAGAEAAARDLAAAAPEAEGAGDSRAGLAPPAELALRQIERKSASQQNRIGSLETSGFFSCLRCRFGFRFSLCGFAHFGLERKRCRLEQLTARLQKRLTCTFSTANNWIEELTWTVFPAYSEEVRSQTHRNNILQHNGTL